MSLVGGVSQTTKQSPVIQSHSGWTIQADPESGVLSLSHESLGEVLKEIRLNIKNKQGLSPVSNWTAVKKGEKQITIQTLQPFSAWIFELNQNSVTISCTLSEMVLTAEAPASDERIVARLMDSQGVPVDWTGTTEIMNSWKGFTARAINRPWPTN